MDDYAEPLYNGHCKVNSCADVVGSNTADKSVEFRGCWTNPKEQRNLNEDENERACSNNKVSEYAGCWCGAEGTDKQIAANMIIKLRLIKFAMPKAKQRMMQSTPVLRL